MTSKKVWVVSSLLVVLLLFVYRPYRTELELSQLDLPHCEMNQKLQTQVTFYVDHAISNPKLETNLKDAIEYGNQVLRNSCIPMERMLKTIEYVDFKLSGGEDEYVIHSRLEKAVGEGRISQHRAHPTDYYVVVLKDERSVFDDGTTGIADITNNNGNNALISDRASIHVLEHELGHIAWAQHKDTWPFPSLESSIKLAVDEHLHFKLKRYARAFTCTNAGTVMSYEERILPIYSSPEIRYRGKACGDSDVADNARVLREYAMDQMAILQEVRK